VSIELQNTLLKAIKTNLPTSISFVDELADVLELSRDSAYRRIRGETLLNIQEIQKLVKHFNLSLDSILNLDHKLSFDSKSIDLTEFTISKYLSSILENLTFLSQLENNKIIYSARDIPIFHYFVIPELSHFKIFCWLKTYLNDPELHDLKFDLDHLPAMVEESSAIGSKIWRKYIKLPSIEIWTSETIIITLKQLNYYKDAGLFADPSISEYLMEKYIDLLLHIQNQAEIGRKFNMDSTAFHEGSSYDLYYNEVAQGDNSVLFYMGEKKIAFITYCTLNYLSTTNEKVCSNIDRYFQSLIKTSLLLSRTSEKERKKFFNNLVYMVNTYSNRL
jgi:plasmid maintenance system antidote protein VapI